MQRFLSSCIDWAEQLIFYAWHYAPSATTPRFLHLCPLDSDEGSLRWCGMRKHESVRMPTRKAEQRCLSKASLRLTSAKSGHEAKCDIPGVYTFSFLRLHQGLIQDKKVKQIPRMSVQPRTMVKSSQVMLLCDLRKAGDEVTCLKRASTFPMALQP